MSPTANRSQPLRDRVDYLWGGRATLLFNSTLKQALNESVETLEAFIEQHDIPFLGDIFG